MFTNSDNYIGEISKHPIQLLIFLIAILVAMIYFAFKFINLRIKSVHPTEKISADLSYGIVEWEQEMRKIASEHKRVKWMFYNPIIEIRNQKAYKRINKIRTIFSAVSSDIITLIPAARWLFDNFPMIYRELKKVKTTGTSRKQLPVLLDGEFKDYPRIYMVARKIVALTRGHINEENIDLMMKAYQEVLPLTSSELWALPEMLGFCLLEEIIFVTEDIVRVIETKAKADKYIKDNIKGDNRKVNINLLLKQLDPQYQHSYPFHSYAIYLLKNMSVDEIAIQKYVEYFFYKKNITPKPSDIFTQEGKLESALESSIRSLIVSMRIINELEGESLFENLSTLEKMLKSDPAGIYPLMEQDSKGIYRSIIEKFALKHDIDEKTVCRHVLDLAVEGDKDLNNSNHVGTYLVGAGFNYFKARVLGRSKPAKASKKKNLKGAFYFFFISMNLILIYYLLILTMTQTSMQILGYKSVIILFAALCPAIGIAVDITNNLFTRLVPVKMLPAMDFSKDIPDEARTFVVIPVIVFSRDQALEHMRRLQKTYLANKQCNLFFALLVDFADSHTKTLATDDEITSLLIEKIQILNDTYPSSNKKFSLFIRERQWNDSEDCYMCWERKRGKLDEFNSLLLGDQKTSFSTIVSDSEIFPTFKYVITLDADSDLISNNASKLVGMMEHPLNQPIIDEKVNSITEGYAIIQPSVSNHIGKSNNSKFCEVFGCKFGIDQYSSIISDIYQDIFGEGIFVGKGIYHIRAFHQLLHNVIPSNRILSHDLIESCYVRTAFSCTTKIMDGYPGSVISYAKREHRWLRGDWQLLPWLFGQKTITGISRWKILDNLRRSLIPLSKTLFIIFNLALIPDVPFLWIPLVFFNDVLTFIILMGNVINQKIRRPKLAIVYKGLFKEILMIVQRSLLDFMLIAYRTYISLSAISITLYRIIMIKKNFLVWNSMEIVEKSMSNTIGYYFAHMWTPLVPSAVIVVLLFILNPGVVVGVIFGIVALVWSMSYLISYLISQPRVKSSTDYAFLRIMARRTWQFFKDFTTVENNWLCPDNYQMAPAEKVTEKTSPTNIGLQLMSIISARDLGFETLGSAIGSLENVFYTLSILEKWNGHLFNWYNIRTLEVLNPQYISTVDSGNFFGHLISVKNALIEYKDNPVISQSMATALEDLFKIADKDFLLKNSYSKISDFAKELSDILDDFRTGKITTGDKSAMKGRERSKERDAAHFFDEIIKSINLILYEIKELSIEDNDFAVPPTLRTIADRGNHYAKELINNIDGLVETIDNMLAEVDFKPLFNEKRLLFHIGYHLGSQRLDSGCYDLMASESSLTSFLAISRGEVPMKHWYKLGRPMTIIKGIPCFVSWSGTMFEYLMPKLVMKEYENSVFAESSKAAVLEQIIYAKKKGIPWGMSESQYYRFDLDSNYQYKANGVPKIRLQPQLSDSLVIAPYATVLALDYSEKNAVANLERIAQLGGAGRYGYFEALDFNTTDPTAMTQYAVIKSFMAHHQGMNIVAINNYINNKAMVRRFHAEPIIQATEVILEQIRQSHFVAISRKGYNIQTKKTIVKEPDHVSRYVNMTSPEIPVAHYISNNNYSMMITSDGDGFSEFKGTMINRWRSDLYANTGNYTYIKDLSNGRYWSNTYNPTRIEPDEYQAIFSRNQAEFKRRDKDISTDTRISISPVHNIEIRKITLINHSREEKEIEITSYIEVVADRFMAELGHPAFNKLFIENDYLPEYKMLLARRRSSNIPGNPYIVHSVICNGEVSCGIEYENDRMNFIGRNNTVQNPDAITGKSSLSSTTEFSGDPIMCLRIKTTLKENETRSIAFLTGICQDRDEVSRIGNEISDMGRIEDLFEKFRLQCELELKYINITSTQLNAFQDLISPIFYPSKYFRGPAQNMRRNWKNQSFLWRFGVSGDWPIMLLKIKTIEEAGILSDVLKAYEFLRINQLKIDLIILVEAKHGYLQDLTDLINDMTRSLKIYEERKDRPSLFVIHSYQMVPAEIDLLYTVARVVFTENTGIYFRNIREELNMFEK